jgi:pyruvate kinase
MSTSRAQIIASIGPSSRDAAVMRAMIEAGMDVGRINFSYGTREENARLIDRLRAEAVAAGKNMPIIQDLSGPRVQTGDTHAYSGAAAITEKDRLDLDTGVQKGVEYVAQSFVGSAEDIRALRAELSARASKARVIAKIERKEAVEAIDSILAEADAIMIARGDLGEALPREDIPFVQKTLIEKSRAAGRPVITATQMLYSMTENPEPTRAEVTDVEYAIMLGTDAVMLSDETTRGEHPAEAVAEMERIVSRVERVYSFGIRAL